MRRYKLDGEFVDADTFIEFLKVGVKQLETENKILNNKNKELKIILSFKNDVAYSMHQYKMKYEDAIFEIDKLKEENEELRKANEELRKSNKDLCLDRAMLKVLITDKK